MKRRIALLLTVLALALAAGAQAESHPLLYRVTDTEGHTVYLLGTIHVGREDFYPLSDAVEQAYAEAEVLAVEADILAFSQNLIKMTQMSMALMYGPGDDATKHMSPENYALAVEKINYPEILLRRMRLAAWMSLTEELSYDMAGLSSDLGVDMHLLRRAHADGKPIDELEGMEEQMELLLGLPDSIVEMQIMSSLENTAAAAAAINTLALAWQNGNEALFTMLLQSEDVALDQLPEEIRADYEAYMDAMYQDRNAGFEEQAIRYLADGKTALIAIGAAHIVGEDGLAQRLARDGFTVEEIGH